MIRLPCVLLILGTASCQAAICPRGESPSGTLYVADTRGMSIMALSWTYNPAVIRSAIDRCGDEYVFVTAEQMVDLFKQSGSTRPPG